MPILEVKLPKCDVSIDYDYRFVKAWDEFALPFTLAASSKCCSTIVTIGPGLKGQAVLCPIVGSKCSS